MSSDRGRDAPARRHLPARLLRWPHRSRATGDELAHAIHGTVVGAAAMAAASLHGTLTEVVVTVLVTVVVYWAAERYAQVLAAAAVGGPGRAARVRAALRQGRPMIEAAYTPLIVLVAVELLAGDLRVAVLTALGVATLLLGGLGHGAARRAGTSTLAAVGWGGASAALGVVIILLKLSLH